MNRRRLQGLIAFFLMLLMLVNVPFVSAQESTVHKVRVGCYFDPGAGSGTVKSGYNYDYLQKVAYYAGWQYEYIYAGWAELYDLLLSGGIDVMCGVSSTSDREGWILFPDEVMGWENYYLYRHSDDTSVDLQDLSTLNGKRIGTLRNTTMSSALVRWVQENDVSLRIVYYDTSEDQREAFRNGSVDFLVNPENNADASGDAVPVLQLGERTPYYLAVSVTRPDLLQELNSALRCINELESYFLTGLAEKYNTSSVSVHALSEAEQAWLSGRDTLTIGYFDNYSPYCFTDSQGSAAGLITDVMKEMLLRLELTDSLTVKYIPYANCDDMTAALKDGTIDAAFPVGEALWYAEQENYCVTSSVASAGMRLVYRGAYTAGTVNRIAVNSSNRMQRLYTMEMYPGAQIIECGSAEACIEAVLGGRADSTVINGMRVNGLTRGYESLNFTPLYDSDDRCFGVPVGNAGLLMLLNRGIKLIGRDFGMNAAQSYIQTEYTVNSFLRENLVTVLCTAAAVIGLILLAVLFYLRVLKRQKKELETAGEELKASLDTAEKQRRRAEAFASVYFNSWEIGVEDNSITELHGDPVYPGIVRREDTRADAAMERFVRIGVGEEAQRAEVSNFLKTENIARALKDHHEISMEYRGVVNRWNRLTAVPLDKDSDGNVTRYLLGVKSITEEKRLLEDALRQTEDSLRITRALSKDYLNIYLIHPHSHTLHILKLDGYLTEGLDRASTQEYPYEETCMKYISNRVLEQDRGIVSGVMDMHNLLARVTEENDYVGSYRVQIDGVLHYYSFKYVLVPDTGDIIAGFQNVDSLVAKDREKNDVLEKANEDLEMARREIAGAYGIVEGLSQEFKTLWTVNRSTLQMRLVRAGQGAMVEHAVQQTLQDPDYDRAIGRYIGNAVSPEDRSRVLKAVASRVVLERTAQPGIYTVNYQLGLENGHKTYHQMAFANAASETGEPMFVLGFRDVDDAVREEQRKQEELARALVAAEQSDRAKTEFLNSMSHDIRTPMNAILDLTRQAADHADNAEQVRDDLSKINTSGEQLLKLFNDVLDMSRIEGGQGTQE